VAIIAFGLQQAAGGSDSAWAILATVPLIVVPAGIFTLSRALMQMRIGAYIRAFFEERSPDASWEQVLAERSLTDRSPDFWLKAAIFSGYAVVALAGLFIAWGMVPTGNSIAQIIMWSESVLVAALAAGVAIPLTRGKRERLENNDLPAFRELSESSMCERDGRFWCDADGPCRAGGTSSDDESGGSGGVA
jgi:hypothetical protein